LFSSLRLNRVSAEDDTMTDSFWWHLLAGFILGFGVSTLWEWLYFRRKRTTIRDRYVAELEATVRTYAAAASQSNVNTAGDWSEPRFEKPPVFLETEENLTEERSREQKPSVASPFSGSVSHPQTALRSVGSAPAPLTSVNPKLHRQGISPDQSAAGSAHPQTATASFRSVAVQQPTSASDRSQTPAVSQGEAYRESTFAEEPARRIEPAPSFYTQERPSLPEDVRRRRIEPSMLSLPQEQPSPTEEDESSRRAQPLTPPPSQATDSGLAEDAQSQRVEAATSSHLQARSVLSEAPQPGRVEAVASSHSQAPPSRTEIAQAEELEPSISLRPQKDSTSLDEDAQLKRSELTASSPLQEESAPPEAGRPTPTEPVTSAPAQERSSAAEASQARRTASTSSSAPYLAASVPSETQKFQKLSPTKDASPETMQHAAAVEPGSGSPATSQTSRTGEEAAQQPFAALHLERAGATPAADAPSQAPSAPAGERRESVYFVFPNGYQAPPEASRTEPTGRENAEQAEPTRETPPSAQGSVAAPQPETKSSASMDEQIQLSPAETAPAEASAAMATDERTGMQRERLSVTAIDAAQSEGEPSPSGEAAACQDEVAAPPMRQGKIYTTVITSRTEWMLVRVVQAMVQFVRQVRSAITGEDAPCSEPRLTHDAALCEDDLTRISGLTPAHAERLKAVGVTRYTQLAALTLDELRMLTFTPDAAKPIDYEQWRQEAATLAASQERGRR